ncbi:MAG: Cyclopentanol dehydrogenase [Candidatus Marinimicrobia bacterium]|nr:Cyclopentanol dehydrogenase [Candidatus Neomarinimicrobiota bacterium]
MNKVILITGASSGIGKTTALRLLNEGYTVYGAARRVGEMQVLEENGGHALHMDVTDHESVTGGVEGVLDEQGRIDVLINNAGYAVYGAIEDTDIDEARHQFEVNLFGLADLTKEVLPVMRDQESGTIINISSMGGKIYTPLGAWYHASKHALEGWSDSLRLEVKQFGIDVVIIEPGIIETGFEDVLKQPLLDRSGDGPYREMAEAVTRTTRDSYENNSSPASVVAGVIARAIRAKKPKTRYAMGKMAKMTIFLRKYLSDRLFDAAMLSQVK